MDFFTAQDHARRNTGRWVVLLLLAIVSLIGVTTLVVAIALYMMGASGSQAQPVEQGVLAMLSWELLVAVAVGVLALVGFGGLYKQRQLRRGGRVVAEALGGRLINLDTRDHDERRILNVVEEMAIASGTAVPAVYVLEEEGINAFAAGYQPADAVVGITRGAIRQLTRDELQGVVAHEFSHILHGDMRLNIRLVSLLHGVLLIGLAGGMMLRSLRFRRVSNNKRDNSAAVVLGLGLALTLIGYAGTFFGGLIKSAVSRQREYLADAAAVQYTRNPQGIGGALVKVGAHAKGSHLSAPQAAEFSHLFFSQGVSSGLSQLMATHPPLKSRIQRVLPDWHGRFEALQPAPSEQEPDTPGAEADPRSHGRRMGGMPTSPEALFSMAAMQVALGAMGQPDPRHLQKARDVIDALPATLVEAAHEPYSARALIYAMLLSDDDAERTQQLAALEAVALPDVFAALHTLKEQVARLDVQLRLPLIELALPALTSLSTQQAQHFRLCLERLIHSDGKVSLFEWTLYQLLLSHLSERHGGAETLTLEQTQAECQRLLGVLAEAGVALGQAGDEAVAAALRAAQASLPFTLSSLQDADDMQALSLAVERLRRLKPLHKARLLNAMTRCVEHSGVIRAAEAELFRAVADMLGCPVPPLLEEPDSDTHSMG
ncbi:MAG: M48 family metalloprotease [Halomonas sp.]|nr:M48 family metalloprotease [Halomonas sp.]